jgi:hypothetical protein
MVRCESCDAPQGDADGRLRSRNIADVSPIYTMSVPPYRTYSVIVTIYSAERLAARAQSPSNSRMKKSIMRK